MIRIAIAAALIAAVLALGLALAPAQASAGGRAEDAAQEDAFARAIAAYDAGRYGEAARLWSGLSGAGHRDAIAALAGLYRQGLGVARDLGRAASLYRRAGLRGHVIAQANFGEMLERGEGRSRARDHPLARAWAWYRIAGEGGNTWAEIQANRVWATLGSTDRHRARALLAAIRKEIPARP
jgi:TPR repeat protein